MSKVLQNNIEFGLCSSGKTLSGQRSIKSMPVHETTHQLKLY